MGSHARQLTRREFVGETARVTGALAFASAAGSLVYADEAPLQVPSVELGRTGESVSRLGVGCAHFQRPHITVDHVSEVIHRAVEIGVNYLDTAPNYVTGDSHAEAKMGPAIKEIRDKVFLATKTEEPTYEGTWQLLRQSMQRLQTDRLDLVHLHNFGEQSRFKNLGEVFSDKGALGALREARKLGVIRFIGASGHLYPSRFNEALNTGEIDVLMNAVNFVIQHTYNFEDKVWKRAREENIGLVAMKVLGGAAGSDGYKAPAEQYESAIRYAMGIPGCHCLVIGVASVQELEQAARVIARSEPLAEDERARLAALGMELAKSEGWVNVYGTPVA